mgnify:CR=1 FL=1
MLVPLRFPGGRRCVTVGPPAVAVAGVLVAVPEDLVRLADEYESLGASAVLVGVRDERRLSERGADFLPVGLARHAEDPARGRDVQARGSLAHRPRAPRGSGEQEREEEEEEEEREF